MKVSERIAYLGRRVGFGNDPVLGLELVRLADEVAANERLATALRRHYSDYNFTPTDDEVLTAMYKERADKKEVEARLRQGVL